MADFTSIFADAAGNWDLEELEQSVGGYFWMEGDSLAPPLQTPMEIVQAILEFAPLDHSSVLYDLGCGDGRICAMASKIYGCKSVGVEIEPQVAQKFRSNIKKENLESLVRVVEGDLRELDLKDATVIVLYLLPESIEEITPFLIAAINRGATLICNSWGPRALTPDAKVTITDVNLYKYDQSSLPNLADVVARRSGSFGQDLDDMLAMDEEEMVF